MPISFTQVQSTGDALPNNRHVLYFPRIPTGIGSQQNDGFDLTLRHTNVTLPPLQVGQIVVKQQGWSVAFAGRRVQQNTFSTEFVETNDAPVVKKLAAWQDSCAGFTSALGKLKIDYSVTAMCVAYDTAGEQALITMLYGVWPMTITYGQYTEDTGPSMVNVDFSVDGIDIIDVITNDTDFETSQATAGIPELYYQSLSDSMSNRASGLNLGAFNVGQNVVSDLGLTQTTFQNSLTNFFA